MFENNRNVLVMKCHEDSEGVEYFSSCLFIHDLIIYSAIKLAILVYVVDNLFDTSLYEPKVQG